jgi:hypothetical protein
MVMRIYPESGHVGITIVFNGYGADLGDVLCHLAGTRNHRDLVEVRFHTDFASLRDMLAKV